MLSLVASCQQTLQAATTVVVFYPQGSTQGGSVMRTLETCTITDVKQEKVTLSISYFYCYFSQDPHVYTDSIADITGITTYPLYFSRWYCPACSRYSPSPVTLASVLANLTNQAQQILMDLEYSHSEVS